MEKWRQSLLAHVNLLLYLFVIHKKELRVTEVSFRRRLKIDLHGRDIQADL